MKNFLILLFISLTLFACQKDEPTQPSVAVVTERNFILEEQEWPKITERAGVTPAPFVYRTSTSINHYLVGGNQHDFFAHVVNVTGRKVSAGTAILIPSNVEIANYDITYTFVNGSTKFYPNVLHKYEGELFSYAPNSATQLMHTASDVNHVKMVRDRTLTMKYRHKFKSQVELTLHSWDVYFDDVKGKPEWAEPPHKGTHAWNPGHSL